MRCPPLPAPATAGYYPALFYPKIGQLAKNFTPKFTTAYYVKVRKP